MIVIVLLGLFFFGVAATVLARAIAGSRVRTVETVGRIDAYGFRPTDAAEDEKQGSARATLDGLADTLGALIAKRFGNPRENEIQAELRKAAIYSISPRKFMGYQALSAVSVPIFWAWLATAVGFPVVLMFVILIAALPLGWMAPLTIVRRRARRRVEEVDEQLPELIDLLVVTVEAGLGLTGALRTAADRLGGALGAELRLTLQEQSFGLSTNEALENMLARCDTPPVRSFVRSVVQSEALGVSMGQILRNLTIDMRKRRRAQAEERAHKAPVKMLFPLIFLIFPAIFVVLLVPALYSIAQALQG